MSELYADHLLFDPDCPLGRRIFYARTWRGLSLRKLAEQVGVSAMAISKYERGIMKPRPEVRDRLEKALRLSLSDAPESDQ